jgi:4-amino-4-deoxy-L-arabinose transferase-like glycosyltransferase
MSTLQDTLPSARPGWDTRRVIRGGTLVVVAALAVRLAALVVLHAYEIPADQDHFAFGGEMGRMARAIVNGQGMSSPFGSATGPSALVGPVYPYMLAGVFKLFGTYSMPSAWVMLSLNALFSSLTCLPIRMLADRAIGPPVGQWSGWIWAFFPYAIYWPLRWVWDTSVSTFLLATLLTWTMGLERSPCWRAWAGFGACWGLAVLTNTTLLVLFPVTLGWLCFRQQRWSLPGWAGRTALAVVVFSMVLSPWLVRNYLVLGHVVLRSNFGLELYQGNHEGATGLRDSGLSPAYNAREMEEYSRMGELPYMAAKERQAREFIEAHPGTFLWLCVRRAIYFWTGTSEVVVRGHVLESLALYTLVSVLAGIGVSSAMRTRAPGASLLALTLLLFPLPYYVTHPEPRFRHLIEPEMIILAVSAFCFSPRRRLGEPRR